MPACARRQGRRGRWRRLRVAGLICCCGVATLPASDWILESPEVELVGEILTLPRGVVLRNAQGWTLLADALRWNLQTQTLFASGEVVLHLPIIGADGAVLIEASALGWRGDMVDGQGEAWDLRIAVARGDGPALRLRAARAAFSPTAIELTDVQLDRGHGGVASVALTRLRLLLVEEADGRRGVQAITAWHPRASLAGLPLLWLPVAHRDFRYDWPWTRYRFGRDRRDGAWMRAELAWSLPPLAGLVLTPTALLDARSHAGTGYGLGLRWQHDLGRGEVETLWVPRERVRRTASGPVLATRRAEAVDAWHRSPLPGGALAARWVSVPGPDPGAAPDERFRADRLADHLRTRSFARRGAMLALTRTPGSLVLGSELRHDRQLGGLDRELVAGLQLSALPLAAALRLEGALSAERLRDHDQDQHADRGRWRLSLALDHRWHSGLGLDLAAGLQGLGYAAAELGGVDVADGGRSVPVLSAGLSQRWELPLAEGRLLSLSPRLGLRLHGSGWGDELPALDFSDGGDQLDERLELLCGDVALGLSQAGRLRWRMVLSTAWYLDEGDRPEGRAFGRQLHEGMLRVSGRPIASLDVRVSARWDGPAQAWERFDGGLDWAVHPRLALAAGLAHLPQDDDWRLRPGLRLRFNRYGLDGNTEWAQRSESWRRWELTLRRGSVDGQLKISYVGERDAEGDADHRFAIGFDLRPF